MLEIMLGIMLAPTKKTNAERDKCLQVEAVELMVEFTWAPMLLPWPISSASISGMGTCRSRLQTAKQSHR